MIELIKEVSKHSKNEKLAMTQKEYDALIKELHELDDFLREKYLTSASVPRIYSLYGVAIEIVRKV